LPRQEVITKAKEIIAEAAPNPEPPNRSLDEMLAERWNRFIKDIPVTDHTAVRLWVTAKLKEAAL
jgi:translation elongation factor EF-Ts